MGWFSDGSICLREREGAFGSPLYQFRPKSNATTIRAVRCNECPDFVQKADAWILATNVAIEPSWIPDEGVWVSTGLGDRTMTVWKGSKRV